MHWGYKTVIFTRFQESIKHAHSHCTCFSSASVVCRHLRTPSHSTHLHTQRAGGCLEWEGGRHIMSHWHAAVLLSWSSSEWHTYVRASRHLKQAPSGDRARKVMSTICQLQLFHIQFVNINVLIFAIAANVLKVLISFRIKGRTTKHQPQWRPSSILAHNRVEAMKS